jgi:hypothetical protein
VMRLRRKDGWESRTILYRIHRVEAEREIACVHVDMT